MAQQAVQVYYTRYANQDKEDLKGWAIVHQVSPHGKLPTQTMMITTSTQTHMMDSSIKKMGYQARLR